MLDPVCLTISHLDAPFFDGGVDPLVQYNTDTPGNELPENYRHSIRYHYAFDESTGQTEGVATNPAILIGTTVNRGLPGVPVPGSGPMETITGNKVFHYENQLDWYSDRNAHIPWLEAIFTNEDIGRLLASDGEDLDGDGDIDLDLPGDGFGFEHLARWRTPSGDNIINTDADEIIPFASSRFDRGVDQDWPSGSSGIEEFPLAHQMLDQGATGVKLHSKNCAFFDSVIISKLNVTN